MADARTATRTTDVTKTARFRMSLGLGIRRHVLRELRAACLARDVTLNLHDLGGWIERHYVVELSGDAQTVLAITSGLQRMMVEMGCLS